MGEVPIGAESIPADECKDWDGRLDLAVANTFSDSVSILLNSCGGLPAPTATPSQTASSSTLSAWVEFLDPAIGLVTINGVDTRRPTIPFTFDWGDGATTTSFFLPSHVYVDRSRNYTVTVTAHYDDGSTSSVQVSVNFVAPSPTLGASSTPTRTGTPVPPATATGTQTAGPTPTTTSTAGPVGGRQFTLDAGVSGLAAVTWNRGTAQTAYILMKADGNTQDTVVLAGSATSYTDLGNVGRPLTCYLLIPVSGLDALGVSPLLCILRNVQTGPVPGSFTIGLEGGSTVSAP